MALNLKIFIDNVEADLEAREIKGTIYLPSTYRNEEHNLKTFIKDSIRFLIDEYEIVTSITINIINSNSLEVTVILPAPPQTSLEPGQSVTLYLNLNIQTSKVTKNINKIFILEEQSLNEESDGSVEIIYKASIQNQISENALNQIATTRDQASALLKIIDKRNVLTKERSTQIANQVGLIAGYIVSIRECVKKISDTVTNNF